MGPETTATGWTRSTTGSLCPKIPSRPPTTSSRTSADGASMARTWASKLIGHPAHICCRGLIPPEGRAAACSDEPRRISGLSLTVHLHGSVVHPQELAHRVRGGESLVLEDGNDVSARQDDDGVAVFADLGV